MCGRFAIAIDKPTFSRRFRTSQLEIALESHYNVAPGMFLPVVIRQSPNRAVLMKWGLVPHWSKTPTVKFSTINARMENLASSAVYRMPFAQQRCLVPASGFYEWARRADGSKWPHYFSLPARPVFAFAGLWDRWTDVEGKPFLSCAIVTCPANDVVGQIHPRMPVILSEQGEQAWLDRVQSPRVLTSLLVPYDSAGMTARRVSNRVNSTRNDDKSLIDQFEDATLF